MLYDVEKVEELLGEFSITYVFLKRLLHQYNQLACDNNVGGNTLLIADIAKQLTILESKYPTALARAWANRDALL